MPYTLAQAREIVKTNVQASVDPTLTDGEVETILAATAWAGEWTAATDYAYGDRVLPTTRNGHLYVVTTAGTSDTTEPDWPTAARSSISDGADLVWQEAGAAGAEVYDVRTATYAAWQLKLSKAQGYFDFSADGQSVSRAQVVSHIERAMRAWAPVGVV